MKQKIFVVLFLISCLSYSSLAQLTTGKSTANVVRNGNRASEGDFGIYFGTTTNIINKVRNSDVSLTFMPLVNLKYMATDHFEWRLGLELNKWSTTEDGTQKDVKENSFDTGYKYTDVENSIYPGFAYHFSNTNLLDVYLGAELPLGYNRLTNNQTLNNTDYINSSSFAYHIGLGGFLGVQAYVANLPIAIGVEYGISSMFDFGLKTKHETKIGDNDKQVTYTSDLSGINYDKLSARKGEVGNQIRLTLTYFFNK